MVLGFTPYQALMLMFAVITGGMINIPVKTWEETYTPPSGMRYPFLGLFPRRAPLTRKKFLAVNLGGAIIPGVVSLWQIYRILTEFSETHPHGGIVFIFVLMLNTLVSYRIAKPVENRGISLPAFIPPIVVSVPSLLLAPGIAPVIAFPAGVLGVLIGADLMHLGDIRNLNGPGGSIGGAGTFDGVFLTGVLSVFLTV